MLECAPEAAQGRFAAVPDLHSADEEVGMYAELNFDRDELSTVMRTTYDELIAFVTTPAFRAVYTELMSLPATGRPAFVNKVLLQRSELSKRGVHVPEGVLLQTSAFGDRRPTLFAVKKFLPLKYHEVWENVNLTFDNPYRDEDVSRLPEDAWRAPLPVSLQNALIARGSDLESIPVNQGIVFVADPPS
jgi:hypothetical protein